MNEHIEKAENIGTELGELHSKLSSHASSIGDWKIIKIYEARLMGGEDPYDLNELVKERQKVRDRINELEMEFEAIVQESIAMAKAVES